MFCSLLLERRLLCRLSLGLLPLVLSAFSQLPAQRPGFSVASIFGDHMVLPAGQEVPLHGRGVAGQKVIVQPSWGDAVETIIDASGKWQVLVATPPRGQNGSFTLRCGEVLVQVDDVLFGDVWLASGQSNMEMPIGAVDRWRGVEDWQREVQNANHPLLRVFTTVRQATEQPADRLLGEWVVCSPKVAAQLSATGYFFARDLVVAGKGPIGLVVSSWGGTRCEAWTRAAGLADFPVFAAELSARQPANSGSSVASARARFLQAVRAAKPMAAAVTTTLPERWSQVGLQRFDGVVDYERTIELPAAFIGRELRLQLGAIDDMDTVFWNGKRIAGSERPGVWNVPRRYVVSAVHTGAAPGPGPTKVTLRIRVIDTGGEGGFAARPTEMRLLVAGQARSLPSLSLAGPWQRTQRVALADLPPWPRRGGGANRPAVLWNGMIAPLLPFPFTGCIWYQGESNRSKPEQYRRLFVAMIRDWRRALGRDVPFYFVQIAPYAYGSDGGLTAELRSAQAAALALPSTGMVVTLDCGNARDIHPAAKQPVGARLALLARARHYGDDVACSGPRAVEAERTGQEVRVRFAAGVGQLELLAEGRGFELAGEHGRFQPATARIDGDELVLMAHTVPKAAMVRYAWRAVPDWSLRNAEGLLAAPFSLAVR